MSKKNNKKLEETIGTAVKVFGFVAAVGLGGMQLLRKVQDGSILPPESAAQHYDVVKGLATSSQDEDTKPPALTSGKVNQKSSYTLSELQELKEHYEREKQVAFRQDDLQRHSWLRRTLDEVDLAIECAIKVSNQDFAYLDPLKESFI